MSRFLCSNKWMEIPTQSYLLCYKARQSFLTQHKIHCQILMFCVSSHLRYIGESVVTGRDCLWLGPVWGLPLCLLEAMLDTMEGAWTLAHHKRSPRAPQPHHESSALSTRTQAASLHRRGPTNAQPPWVLTLLLRQRAHPCGIRRVSGGSGDSCITTTCGHGHTWGSYEDKSHISRHPTGRPDQKPGKWDAHHPSYAATDHWTLTVWSLNIWNWVSRRVCRFLCF